MWSNKRALISSFVVGMLGAALVAGIISVEFISYAVTFRGMQSTQDQLPAAVTIGFLVCFFISLLFLKLMRGKHWGLGIGFGLLFGAIAGAIIAYTVSLYGCTIEYLQSPKWWKLENSSYGVWVGILWAFIPAVFGAFIGAFVGFILSLAFGPWLLNIINKPAIKQG